MWWGIFKTIFEIDPNSLVHGVLFPQWQIKIPRALTAHLEAFGASRVDRSGVKFDRLGKTASGQPIFAVDDPTAESIRATFVLDISLIRSFGRKKRDTQLGLSEKQQQFLVALALWKIQSSSSRRSASGQAATSVTRHSRVAERCGDRRRHQRGHQAPSFPGGIAEVFSPREELYREGKQSDGDGNGASDGTEGRKRPMMRVVLRQEVPLDGSTPHRGA